jgi:hypothetical protein
VAVVSSWRQEGRDRERDDREREEFRSRRLRTKAELRAEIDALIESGELTVRQATPDERARYRIRPAAEEPCKTTAELAAEAGVSQRSMERTLRVRKANPELSRKVAAGELSASAADDQLSRMEGKGR